VKQRESLRLLVAERLLILTLITEELRRHTPLMPHKLGSEHIQRQHLRRRSPGGQTAELLAIPGTGGPSQRRYRDAGGIMDIDLPLRLAAPDDRVDPLHHATDRPDGIGRRNPAVGPDIATPVAPVGTRMRVLRPVQVNAIHAKLVDQLGKPGSQAVLPDAVVADRKGILFWLERVVIRLVPTSRA